MQSSCKVNLIVKAKMLRSALLAFFLLWGQDSVCSVRIVEMRVPAYEREGGTALLDCHYDMEGETLYSVKWYKDELEFFRYLPKNNPQTIAFKRPGIYVNMELSSTTRVALENLTRESEGIYSCEVSGETPSFNTTKSHRTIEIHLLPDSGPYMTGVQESYYLDQMAVMNCSTSASRPSADLKWLINDKPVSKSFLKGPWYRLSSERTDAYETTLQLRFMVAPEHFVGGTMHLKCLATIVPLYQRETKSAHYVRLPELIYDNHGPLIGEPFNHATDTSEHSTVILILCFAFMFNILHLI